MEQKPSLRIGLPANLKGNFRIASVLGIPIEVNASWLITLAFITSMLALRVYPEVLAPGSPYRDSFALHWLMALVSGLVFFSSIVLHELAHSVVSLRQGTAVKSITLFIFGGVSQIAGEARRPLHEFLMAIVGPLMSVLLAGVFFGLWWLAGHNESSPWGVVLEWLFVMNLVVAAFNMLPGFPMDGGRVLRSLIWGVSGNLNRATRLATLVGRGLGYAFVFVGALAFFGVLGFIDPWSGAWFAFIGLFIETSARQSWLQARALTLLSSYKAEQIMTPHLATAYAEDDLRALATRGGRRFIFFVADDDERVVGILTEKEASTVAETAVPTAIAGDVMRRTEDVEIVSPRDDGASMLQTMEAASIWHLPVVDAGRVVGVVSKESLLRLLARGLIARPGLLNQS